MIVYRTKGRLMHRSYWEALEARGVVVTEWGGPNKEDLFYMDSRGLSDKAFLGTLEPNYGYDTLYEHLWVVYK